MKTILIVDDHPEVVRLIETLLRGAGYRLLAAGSGEEAVDLARREHPDLILMDVMMPGEIDGCQATRLLKNSPETAGSVIIVVTAKAQERDRLYALEAGADDFVAKPFDIIELRRKIETFLN